METVKEKLSSEKEIESENQNKIQMFFLFNTYQMKKKRTISQENVTDDILLHQAIYTTLYPLEHFSWNLGKDGK